MRIVLAAIAIVLLVLPAEAQMGGGGRGGGRHKNQAEKTETPKKKIDDKDYKAALGRIPDKKVDPWADKH